MKLKRAIISTIAMILFIMPPLIELIYANYNLESKSLIFAFFCVIAALIDSFFFVIPYFFDLYGIPWDEQDPNSIYFNAKHFVDRKHIFYSINKQIKLYNNKVIWFKLYGEDGIGKKSIISKIFKRWHIFPKHKFYFLDTIPGNDILMHLKNFYNREKKPIVNEKIYLKELQKSKKVFLIIDMSKLEYVSEIIEFINKWLNSNFCKSKLIIISYENGLVDKNDYDRVYIFKYLVEPLDYKSSNVLVNQLVRSNYITDKSRIIEISKGHPGCINYLCTNSEVLNFENRQIDGKEKEIIFCFVILSIVKLKVNPNILHQSIDGFNILKSILKSTDSYVYIPHWIINQIFKNNDNIEKYCLKIINYLFVNNIINDNEKIMAKAATNNLNITELECFFIDLKVKKEFLKIKKCVKYISWYFDKKYICENPHIIEVVFDALLQLGEYDEFKSYLNEVNNLYPLTEHCVDKQIININYHIADYYHLTSDFQTSNQLFSIISLKTNDENIKRKIMFAIGHNYKHMGMLDKAKNYLKSITKDNDLDYLYIRAKSNLIAIEYFMDENIMNNKEYYLNELKLLLTNQNVDYNVFRHISNIYRRTGDIEQSIKILESKVEELKVKKLRIIQDYYFELGECYRFKYLTTKTGFDKALNYYNMAIIFAECNKDENLKYCSMIGKELLLNIGKRNNKKLLILLNKLINKTKNMLTTQLLIKVIITLLEKKDLNYLKTYVSCVYGFNNYIYAIDTKNIYSLHVTVM